MLSCEEYDYIEIACLFNYPVRLDLNSGEAIEGKAIDTKRNSSNEECMEVLSDENALLIVLDHVFQITVLIENPHFQTVSFSRN